MNPETHDRDSRAAAIGIFDSGVGGLSVLREVVRQLPHQDVIYLADSAHVPYGSHTIQEIRAYSEAITAFLMEQGADVVVVACNTASAAALYHLRERFDVPLVGMEPAVKPAAEQTNSQQVGVIATSATFQGELFERLVERFARDTTVHTQVCPDLVERVEAGLVDDAQTEALLRQYLTPMQQAGIDTLVLGCTHYPFLRPAIERIVGPGVAVIDPAPAVARQTARVKARQTGRVKARQTGRVKAQQSRVRIEGQGQVTYFVTGDLAAFRASVQNLVAIPGPVLAAHWDGNTLQTQDWRKHG
jgi:glutamate racemase